MATTKPLKHKFPYRWNLINGYPANGIEKHDCKVFGTFVCGGGSTMGYKLAGYDHLGGVEIDPKVAEVYRLNHKPQHLFVEDIRDFNRRDNLLPELFNLDLLDGSPPCSSFSMAGNREKDWGKQKQFREGQEFQRLDDLVFEYVRTIEKLQPKVALLENVKGLIIGNAKAYAKNLKIAFEAAGYRVQVFLLNAASMGVPQKRERVFFVGQRKDLGLPELKLSFDEKPILYGEFRQHGIVEKMSEHAAKGWELKKYGDKTLEDVWKRVDGVSKNWNWTFEYDDKVVSTITSASASHLLTFEEKKELTKIELQYAGSFPLDYNFNNIDVKYLIGMSVPPVMTAQIGHQIWLQWLSKIK